MKTYLFYQKTSNGLHNVMLIAANSECEARNIANTGKRELNIGKSIDRCYEIPELTPIINDSRVVCYISF